MRPAPRWKSWAISIALAISVAGVFVTFGRARSPIDVAIDDRHRIWQITHMRLDPVLYVGRDAEGRYDYFRVGTLFPTYYKVQTCATNVSRLFPVGTDSYEVGRGAVVLSSNCLGG